jgi:hypothetical protein
MKTLVYIKCILFFVTVCVKANAVEFQLFVGDVDTVAKIFLNITNNTSSNQHISLEEAYNLSKLTVLSLDKRKELPAVSNFIPTPTDDNKTKPKLIIPPKSSIMIMLNLPPVDFGIEFPKTKWILSRFSIEHEKYGKVLPYTDKEDFESIKNQRGEKK